ncbi:MAG: hypothetical protein IT270_16485 [Saprospiraceae bacterium]|nr:hypothetical protein [Saprospiraceae bacterium]
MNLIDLIKDTEKAVSAQNVFSEKGSATLLRIKKDGVLREHQSAVNALLVLLEGKAVYEENGRREELNDKFDFVRIPAKETHKVTGTEDALLMLFQ